ncbi:MAG TPA: hypothetical protein VFV50_17465 [Bdellovibrionales bacterium]|nr:hypothetical protein [Bdellovibrionales bacterium]
MKIILLAFAFLAAHSASAQTTQLKGYVNLDRGQRPWFVAVNVDELELSATYPMEFFADSQVKAMFACMDRKETHVIVIDSTPAQQRNVPTGIPGRTTTTHFPRLDNVRCVHAPGFLQVWRAIVRKSSFR